MICKAERFPAPQLPSPSSPKNAPAGLPWGGGPVTAVTCEHVRKAESCDAGYF